MSNEPQPKVPDKSKTPGATADRNMRNDKAKAREQDRGHDPLADRESPQR